MDFDRFLNLRDLLEKKSILLLGPRATGKSTLIKKQLSGKATLINLLKSDVYLALSENPSLIEGMIDEKKQWVVIDEIQRVTELLNEVHRLIEDKGLRFLLTGSSARKLKKPDVNLLAGRAWTQGFFPLTSREIPDFDLGRYLRFGGLPAVYSSRFPEEELDAYVNTYLKEEVQAEGLIRKVPQFMRFLKTAALSNGQMLNFAAIGSDAQVSASTVLEYFSILQDTLVGFMLEPWTESRKRKAIQTAKFYFFDTGVTHALAGTKTLDRNSDLYGKSFEQFVAMELRAFLGYRRIKEPLMYWRTKNGDEVDFLIGDQCAIEVKSSNRVNLGDAKGLLRLKDEKRFKQFFLVSQDQVRRKEEGVEFLPYDLFLKMLWDGEIV